MYDTPSKGVRSYGGEVEREADEKVMNRQIRI
jgi:hypothetical protein